MNNIQQPVPEPDLRRVLQLHRDEIFASLNCHQVGTIVSFDSTKQTAQVSLNVKRQVYNQTQTIGNRLQLTPAVINYPLLVDCPVFVMTGGPAAVTMPITKGDTCLVLFNDRDLDNWWATGGTDAPNSPRMHDLSDGMVLVGFRSLAQLITAYAVAALELRYGADSKVSVADTGTTISKDTSRLTVTGGGSKVDINAGVQITSPDTAISGNATIGGGATGLFTSGDGKTITVADGVVVNITP